MGHICATKIAHAGSLGSVRAGRAGVTVNEGAPASSMPMFAPHASRSAARAAAAVLVVGALLIAGPGQAQDSPDLRALNDKIDRLQTELSTLQREFYRGEPPAATGTGEQGTAESGGAALTQSGAARLQNRIVQLEEELQQLTGRVEETRFQLRKLVDRVDRLVGDVDYRLRQLEQAAPAGTAERGEGQDQDGAAQTAQTGPAADGGSEAPSQAGQDARAAAAGQPGASAPGSSAGGEEAGTRTLGQVSAESVEELRQQQTDEGGAGSTQTAATPDPSAVLPDGDPQAQYKHAFGLLRQADYAAAEEALRAFVEAHPEHDLAGNAKYWLGETYYVRNDYERAAVTFAEGFRNYPESNKAPDNLLKLGMSLARIDRVDDACGIFAELLDRYPDSARNIIQRARREQQRLSCGE